MFFFIIFNIVQSLVEGEKNQNFFEKKNYYKNKAFYVFIFFSLLIFCAFSLFIQLYFFSIEISSFILFFYFRLSKHSTTPSVTNPFVLAFAALLFHVYFRFIFISIPKQSQQKKKYVYTTARIESKSEQNGEEIFKQK